MSTVPLSPKHEKILQQAQTLFASGQLQAAVAALRKIVKAYPANTLYLSQLGRVLLQAGALNEGVQCLERSLRIEPAQGAAAADLGLALSMLGQHERALARLNLAITHSPKLPICYNNRGLVLHRSGHVEEALADFAHAIKLEPTYGDAWVNQGAVLAELRKFDEAVASYDQAIGIDARIERAHGGRSVVLHQLRRFDEALASIDSAIALRPDLPGLWVNRGSILLDMREFPAARACFERALELKPDYVQALTSLGEVLGFQGRHDAARDCLSRAIALDSEAPCAKWIKAVQLLALGEYDEGWALYEARWRGKRGMPASFPSSAPLWLGESEISGRTILVRPEQGLGDFIQFCRYVPMLVDAGATVIVETPAALEFLVPSLPASFTTIREGDERPEHDLQCPVMSLPHAFRTRLESIPADTPYLFSAPEKLAEWRERLGPKERLRVGIVWSGSPVQLDDRFRSMPLRQLETLFSMPVDFHCLQKEVRPSDEVVLHTYPALQVHGASLENLADTAALIDQLDLVISVCTSVAHLAGAMGKEVWVMLNRFPCYRWMHDRADSPWYPSAVLFRQASPGDWDGVIHTVRERLQKRLRECV